MDKQKLTSPELPVHAWPEDIFCKFIHDYVQTHPEVAECQTPTQAEEILAAISAIVERSERAEKDRDRLLNIFARLREWVQTYGKALCPSGMDTYGAGIQDAHDQVAAILYDISEGE